MAPVSGAATVTVPGLKQTDITSAIGSACDGTNPGTVIFQSGSYAVTSSMTIPGNCNLQAATVGGAVLNGSQNQIFNFNGNNITINGLVLDGGWMAFSNSTTTYSNFTFTNNVVRNITGGTTSGGAPALGLPGIRTALIANNSFSNLWPGGYPSSPPVCTTTCNGTGIDSWGNVAIVGDVGNDHLVITNNTFDKISSDSIHLSWDIWLGNDDFQPNSSGNVISDNVFTHQRRIPIEIQSVASGCPGGCQYGGPSTVGMQIKGNYVHDYSFPYYDTWGASLVPDFSEQNIYMNNTFVANVADGSSVNGWAPCMESSGDHLTSLGNVCANVAGSSHAFGSWFAQGSGYSTGFTNNYQNSIVCGNSGSVNWSYDGQSSTYNPQVNAQYNYLNGASCPAGGGLTNSNIAHTFTTTTNQSLSPGGSGTFKTAVISNLSIRHVQFFLDGSKTPIAMQEQQDVNPNFANDLKWLYHATFSTSFLAGGSHTIAAVATDASGATQTVTQGFSVGGTGVGTGAPPTVPTTPTLPTSPTLPTTPTAPSSPTASVSSSSVSFGSASVDAAAPGLTVTLTNSGSSVLAINSIAIQGTNASDFSQSSQCGSSLAIAASCKISLTFTPSAAGARTATMVVTDNAPGSPQVFQLSGTGIAAVSTPPTATSGAITANATTATIVASPPDQVRFEKTIGYFTSTAYPSYFLGTNQAGYIYDTVAGTSIKIGAGYHYERAKTIRFSGDQFDSLIASDSDQLILYENPANGNGGNANTTWKRFVISAVSGCHDLYVADLDGDGLSDVACSGTYFENAQSFVVFQNSRENWTQPYDAAPTGDSLALIAIKGTNNDQRINLLGCGGGNLYWYQNPGGASARTGNWAKHYIGDCNAGASLATLDVGNRDIVLEASNEAEPTSWASGFAYFDPGQNPSGTWTKTIVDTTYRDVHQIACDTLSGVPFCTLGEQEQASISCNGQGYNDHPTVSGCRVAIYPWNGSGFASPTIVSNKGTQNQALLQLNGVEYMAGANHGYLGGYDTAYHLWKFTFGGSTPVSPVPPVTTPPITTPPVTTPPGTHVQPSGPALAPGTYNFQDSSANTIDSGWDACCSDTVMHQWSYNNNVYQQFVLSSAGTICSVGTSLCLSDKGGYLQQNGADTWAVTQSGSGYTIQNLSTMHYLNPAAQVGEGYNMALSASPSVWSATLQSGGTSPTAPTRTALPVGTYVLQDAASNTLDAGWYRWGGGVLMHEWTYNGQKDQQFTFSSSRTLCDVGTAQCLADSNGTLVQGGLDTWTITPSGTGYTVQNDVSKRYINSPGGIGEGVPVQLSTSATVWNIH